MTCKTKFFIALTLVIYGFKVQAQTASATWALSSSANASVSGNVSAGNQTGGTGIGAMSYGAANGVTSLNWGSVSQNANDYYQFTISPVSGNGFRITSVSTTNNTSPGGVSNVLLQYSFSSSFTSPVTIGNPGTSGTSAFNSLSVDVSNGQAIYVRMFAWGASNETNKTFSCKNFIISGNTLTCPSLPTAGSNSPVCAGSAVNLTSSATGASLTYSWSGPNSFSSSSQNPVISSATIAAGGTYTITISNACGSVSSATSLVINTAPTITTQPAGQTICSGNSISTSVAASGTSLTYQWRKGTTNLINGGTISGATTATLTINPGTPSDDASDYNVVVSGTCTPSVTSNNVSISVVNNPAGANAGSDQNICGTSTTLTGNTPAGGTGAWSIISGTGGTINSASDATSTFTGTAGTYTLRWTITNSPCTSSTDDVVIHLHPLPSATASAVSNAICTAHNGAATVSTSSGTSPFSYSWSNASSTQNISGLAEGNYSVTVTDANGCITSTSVSVDKNTPSIMSSTSSTNATCNGSNGNVSVNAAGGTTPYSWLWSNGSTLQDVSGLSAGDYTVSITDVNGCNTTNDVSISNSSSGVSASLSSVDAKCSESNGSVSISANSGTAPFNYIWSNGATAQTISQLAAGTYSVTISDANGCSTTASATVSNSSATVSATISASPFVCTESNNGTATITVNAGTSPYTYNWSNGATSETATDLASGSYSVIVTDANGCSISQSVIIASKSAPAQPDPITPTGATQIVCPPVNGVVLQTNNDPNATGYSWSTESPGITLVTPSSTNVQTINIATSGSSTYTVRVTASNECGTSPYKAVLFRRSVSVPEISGPANVCANSTQTYSCSVVGATSYKWSGTTGMLINGNAAPYNSADTFVTVTYTSAFTTGILSVSGSLGCFTSVNRTLTVTKNAPALSSISGISAVCPQSSQVYSVPPVAANVTYIWTLPANATGSSSSNSINVNFGNYTATGNICVKAVNSCGMQSNTQCKSLTAGMPVVPGTITGAATQVCGTKTYSVAAVSGITYNWTAPPNASIESGQGTNSVTVNFSNGFTTGSISVTAVNSCGTSAARTLAVSSAVTAPGTITGQSALVCAGAVITYSVPAVSGISFNWTTPSNASVTNGQGTNTVTVSYNIGFTSGNLSVIATNGCANSAARTLVITSLPSTPGIITGPTTQVCAGTSKSYSIPAINGVTFNWTAPANAVISGGQGTNSITVDFNNSFVSGTLSVVSVGPCGSSAAKTLAISSVLAAPVSITGTVNNNCGVTSLFTTRKVTNATAYSWSTNVAGAIVTSEPVPGDTIARITFPTFTTGTVSVGAVNSCGISPLKTLNISGAPSTPCTIMTNPSPVCANSEVQFTSDVSALGTGCTYLWTYPTSAMYVSGQGTPNLVLNWGSANGSVTLKATSNCGNSTRTYNVVISCNRGTANSGQNSNQPKGVSQNTEAKDNNSLNLQAYPDADQKTITFTFNSAEEGIYTYSLLDESNREVLSGIIDAQNGVNMQDLDVTALPVNTVYRLKISNGKISTHINIKMK